MYDISPCHGQMQVAIFLLTLQRRRHMRSSSAILRVFTSRIELDLENVRRSRVSHALMS